MRRVGKTTILYQIIDHLIDEGINPRNILYATFDNPILKLVNAENVLSIYETMYPLEGTRYIPVSYTHLGLLQRLSGCSGRQQWP